MTEQEAGDEHENAKTELKRLKQPTAVTHTVKNNDRSTPR
jgi:hypothetical protein